MSFAICSLALGSGYKKTVELCTQSQQSYALRHGYTYISDESVYDSNRPFAWSKIPLILKYISEYDFIVWMDADVLIMNPEIKLEIFINMMKPSSFMFVGHDLNNLNTGVFVIRNCTLAREFLADVWNKTEYLHHVWWEQAAVIELWKNSQKYRPHIDVLEHRHINIMNAFHSEIDPEIHWLPGDFCIHFAGIRTRSRLDKLQRQYAPQSSTHSSGMARIEKCIKERNIIKIQC
jgi:glycosyltransferase involved in cell wall biosynthesis